MLSQLCFVLRTLIQSYAVYSSLICPQIPFNYVETSTTSEALWAVSTLPREILPYLLITLVLVLESCIVQSYARPSFQIGNCAFRSIAMWFVWAWPHYIQIEALYAIAGVYSDHMIFPSLKSVGSPRCSYSFSLSPRVMKAMEQSPHRPITVHLSKKFLFLWASRLFIAWAKGPIQK